MKANPGPLGLETLLIEIAKLGRARAIGAAVGPVRGRLREAGDGLESASGDAVASPPPADSPPGAADTVITGELKPLYVEAAL